MALHVLLCETWSLGLIPFVVASRASEQITHVYKAALEEQSRIQVIDSPQYQKKGNSNHDRMFTPPVLPPPGAKFLVRSEKEKRGLRRPGAKLATAI